MSDVSVIGGVGRRLRVTRLSGWAWVVLPTIAFLIVVFFLPMITIAWRSFSTPEVGVQNYQEVLSSTTYLRVLGNTAQMAGLTTIVCLLIGYPYAYLMTRVGPGLRTLLLLCVVVPFWSSLLVRSFAWMLLLQDSGLINQALQATNLVGSPVPLIRTMTGVVIGMVHILLPYLIMPMYAQMRKIDQRLLTAAETLGAPPRQAFWRVFFPLSLPGVVSSATLVFLLALGFYVTPSLLGSGSTIVIGELIVQQISGVLNWGVGSALAMVLLVLTLALLAVVARFTRNIVDEGDRA